MSFGFGAKASMLVVSGVNPTIYPIMGPCDTGQCPVSSKAMFSMSQAGGRVKVRVLIWVSSNKNDLGISE